MCSRHRRTVVEYQGETYVSPIDCRSTCQVINFHPAGKMIEVGAFLLRACLWSHRLVLFFQSEQSTICRSFCIPTAHDWVDWRAFSDLNGLETKRRPPLTLRRPKRRRMSWPASDGRSGRPPPPSQEKLAARKPPVCTIPQEIRSRCACLSSGLLLCARVVEAETFKARG